MRRGALARGAVLEVVRFVRLPMLCCDCCCGRTIVRGVPWCDAMRRRGHCELLHAAAALKAASDSVFPAAAAARTRKNQRSYDCGTHRCNVA